MVDETWGVRGKEVGGKSRDQQLSKEEKENEITGFRWD